MTAYLLMLLTAVIGFGVGLAVGGIAGRGAERALRDRMVARERDSALTSRSAGVVAPPIEDPTVRDRRGRVGVVSAMPVWGESR